MKTSELTGKALNWAVTRINFEINGDHIWATEEEKCNYAEDWAQGGPIIEREKITLEWTGEGWNAYIRHDDEYPDGPTPLVAAMRCYVASKLGDEVEIPEELK